MKCVLVIKGKEFSKQFEEIAKEYYSSVEVNCIESYSDEFYKIIRSNLQEIKAGSSVIIGINYPFMEEQDRELLRGFIRNAREIQENLFYFPKPTSGANINNVALFALKSHITLDVFKLSLLQQQNSISIRMKERMQKMIYQEMGHENIFRRFYPESKILFEISPYWKEYLAKKEIDYKNLLERSYHFYPSPKGIGIQLNNICNLQCTMCWHFSPIYKKMHDEETREFYATKKELQTEAVYRILDFAGKYGITVHFSAKGEPTIDKRLPEFVKYARKSGCSVVSLVTNGTLLTKKLSEKLLENGLNRIYFSVDGASPETYKKTRGVELKEVEENICNFLEASKKYENIRVRFNCTLEGNAENELEQFIQKWKPYANEIESLNFTYVNSIDEKGHTSKRQISSDKYDNTRICLDPWLSDLAIVDPIGNVYPSCGCPAAAKRSIAGGGGLLMGNIYQDSFEAIWNGHVYRKLREENLFGNFKFCLACEKCATRMVSTLMEEGNKINMGTRRVFIFDKDEDR